MKLALPRQPPLVSTLHRTSPQLRSSVPVLLERLPLPTCVLVVPRHIGPLESFLVVDGIDTVGTVRRTLARKVRQGSIPVPRREVSRVEKQPDEAHVEEVLLSPALVVEEIPPD